MSGAGTAYVRHADHDAVWKPIAGFTGYEISSDGRILSTRQGRERILHPCLLRSSGYLHIWLIADDGARRDCMLDRLVAEAFLPEPQTAATVRHMDDNRQNNAVANLAWAKQEIEHAATPARETTRPRSSKAKVGTKALDAFLRSVW